MTTPQTSSPVEGRAAALVGLGLVILSVLFESRWLLGLGEPPGHPWSGLTLLLLGLSQMGALAPSPRVRAVLRVGLAGLALLTAVRWVAGAPSFVRKPKGSPPTAAPAQPPAEPPAAPPP